MKKIIIIGAGLTGLSVAYHLNKFRRLPFSYQILETSSRPGGLCKTEKEKGFLFDYTGHLLHVQSSYFRSFIKKQLGSNIVERNRMSWIYSNNVFTKYPFQANLYGLPEKVITECLYEYCKAYFNTDKSEINTFHDWITCNFGNGIAKYFMVPYNRKLFQRHPEKITCDWINRFVPKPDLMKVIQGSVSSSDSAMGYNAKFYYPKKGGIEALIKGLLNGENNIRLNQQVSRISLKKRKIYTSQGGIYPFDIIISTMPIPNLVKILDSKPISVQRASRKLKHVSVLNFNFGVNRKIVRKHWVYIPEEKFLCYRIGFLNNFSTKTAPPGHSSIYTEISYDPQSGIDRKAARSKVVKDLITMGMIRSKDDIVAEKCLDIPHAYVIYDKNRIESLKVIKSYLEEKGIYSIGRYGDWKYSTMEDAVLDGRETAHFLVNHITSNVN